MTIEDLSQTELQEKIEEAEEFLVELYAPWCSPCKQLIHWVENNLDNLSVPVYKANIEKIPEIVGTLNIRSVPTVLYVVDGQIKDIQVAQKGKELIEKFLKG